MTDVSNNLPPGVKPGDSDPPRQKFLEGRFVAEIEVHATWVIEECDCIETELDAMRELQQKIDMMINDGGIHSDQIVVRPIKFEAD